MLHLNLTQKGVTLLSAVDSENYTSTLREIMQYFSKGNLVSRWNMFSNLCNPLDIKHRIGIE